MSFTDIQFWLFFLPILFLIYTACSKYVHLQNAILLVGSIIFYGSYSQEYLLTLALCVCITYLGAVLGGGTLLAKWCANRRCDLLRRVILLGTVALNIGILFWFKYFGFTLSILTRAFSSLNLEIQLELPQILLPVGLSFYVFQSTSYLLDVYYKKTVAETNFLTYATFVCFFPTIISGPILKSKEHLADFSKSRKICWNDFESAVFLFLYGAFLKMVIANRLDLLTGNVFGNYTSYEGWYLLIAAIAYSLQIYTDFAGYSFMAIGVGRLLGFRIKDNFFQPYFADSIIDFWKRWHISLTSWFRDYLYIPLGGNRKGVLRRYTNVMIVFVVSGLWHGASMNFVFWGGLNALLQIMEMTTKNLRKRMIHSLNIDADRFDFRLMKRMITFSLVTLCWIFFRCPDGYIAADYIARMFRLSNVWVLFDNSMFLLGLNSQEIIIATVAIVVMFVVSNYREHGRTVQDIVSQSYLFKYLLFLVLFFSIIIYGIYGAEYSSSSFIYAGF